MPRTSSSSNYSRAETFNMLDCLEEMLSIGSEKWGNLFDTHNDNCKHMKGHILRDANSIWQKFASLHKKKAPTGDPSMREETRGWKSQADQA